MGRSLLLFPRKGLAGRALSLLAAALVVLTTMLVVALPARALSYPDVGHLPAELQAAIDYVSNQGYMAGAEDGKFYPDEPLNRIDYARAVVNIYDHDAEACDGSIKFTDLAETDATFSYANLAVKHGYMGAFPDGSFRPRDLITVADALTGLVWGLDLDEQVAYLNILYPRGPSYRGSMVVAHDLHLKYRDTRAWPTMNYPRCEMAYSLERTDKIEEWRHDYIETSFNWLSCQEPLVGEQRRSTLDAAFSKIGYPYVWGGESDEEGGYDCSGMTYYVLQSVLGYPMMRTADDQARDGRYQTISRAELMAGDPIFFFSDADDPSYVGHAGMYIGHGLFIHSTGSNAGVSVDCLSGYWNTNFAWGKRVIAEGEPETFDTYILLCNPCDTDAAARLTYMLEDGRTTSQDLELAPRSRRTVKVDDLLYNQEVSTYVHTTKGEIVAERAMYFRYKGKTAGGHDSQGVTAPATDWYLPEGCSAYGYDTYVLVQNPGDEAANVTVTFMMSDGTTRELAREVAPNSRETIFADEQAGMETAEFSTRVHSDKPVIVERSMYFNNQWVKGGHNSPGATSTSNTWYFAEGYTADAFDSYLLLMNPAETSATVRVTLLGDDGSTKDLDYDMLPHSRQTVHVDLVPGWEQAAFAVRVTSTDVPVVVERAMYFRYKDVCDGHDAMGSTALENEWFLAEGYTAEEFDTFILLANPGDEDASVTVRFMTGSGSSFEKNYVIGAHSRCTIPVDTVPGLEAQEVSASISSDRGIIAERAMYFAYRYIDGGSCAVGVARPGKDWYFAEGYTGL